MAIHEVELWVVVNADGESGVGSDEGAAVGSYDENYGSGGVVRRIKVVLLVEVPEPTCVEVTVPAREGKVTLTAQG